ncbi:hypothetical protein [Hirschia litorea]|uniref:Uncharacterized protein n=1 Tax=Hirschia litorea TaxID=1199156 RepID=A0ABW2IHJ2_9PROT
MSKEIGTFLRNANQDLVANFIKKIGAPPLVLPSSQKAKTGAVASYLGKLLQTNDGKVASLKYEISRVNALKNAANDRYFALKNRNHPELDSRDRAIWFYVNHIEDFENIERRVSYDILMGSKNQATLFVTEKQKIPDYSSQKIAVLEKIIQQIYLIHDGSGKFVISHIPLENFNEETLSVQISQSPVVLPNFNETGEAQEDAFRKIGDIHFRYNAENGGLQISSTRGGYKVRQELANEFAKLILDVKTSPSVDETERLNLKKVLALEETPFLSDHPDAAIRLVSATIEIDDFPGHLFLIQNNAGLQQDALNRLAGKKKSQLKVRCAGFYITDYLPQGASKKCNLRVELFQDGSVKCKSLKSEQERLLKALITSYSLNG